MSTEKQKHEGNGENFVQVAAVTTSGSYPAEGYENAPANQKVRVFLAEATRKLNITDVSNWIARVGNKEVNPELSYEENGLSGEIDIDFGPRESGGGNA
ncbi:MAG: hypothetical protein FDZ69_13180 [Deltaproteobacteria bacterium]|nr:MAG: hypothetical protein FDZ69_13180 [Deltaproteobacteria bacterium]